MSKGIRIEQRRRKERAFEDEESSLKIYASIGRILAGFLLLYRALASTPAERLGLALLVLRVALALALVAWGILFLIAARRPEPTRFAAWAYGDARSALILSWSAATSVSDILAGAGPAVFVAGVVLAAAISWDKLGRFVILALSGLGLLCLAVFLSSLMAPGSFRLEQILVPASAAVASIAVARTVRTFVAPGRERLRSLERENKQLWDLSFRDTLTGLYNRRFAQETGRILLSRARRYQEQLHVFMIDVDHFKKVNDQLSHAVGDEVLKAVAQSIQSCLRTSDSVARYGGEEFLAFVVQAEAEVAQFIANRIREAVASRVFEGVSWRITISIGVASIQADDDLETLIDRADKYLYSSKRGGRNRVSGF